MDNDKIIIDRSKLEELERKVYEYQSGLFPIKHTLFSNTHGFHEVELLVTEEVCKDELQSVLNKNRILIDELRQEVRKPWWKKRNKEL